MTSGAGHDAVYPSKHCHSAMIFVPCRDGVIYHPVENCCPQDYSSPSGFFLDIFKPGSCSALDLQTPLEAGVHCDQLRVEANGYRQ